MSSPWVTAASTAEADAVQVAVVARARMGLLGFRAAARGDHHRARRRQRTLDSRPRPGQRGRADHHPHVLHRRRHHRHASATQRNRMAVPCHRAQPGHLRRRGAVQPARPRDASRIGPCSAVGDVAVQLGRRPHLSQRVRCPCIPGDPHRAAAIAALASCRRGRPLLHRGSAGAQHPRSRANVHGQHRPAVSRQPGWCRRAGLLDLQQQPGERSHLHWRPRCRAHMRVSATGQNAARAATSARSSS